MAPKGRKNKGEKNVQSNDDNGSQDADDQSRNDNDRSSEHPSEDVIEELEVGPERETLQILKNAVSEAWRNIDIEEMYRHQRDAQLRYDATLQVFETRKREQMGVRKFNSRTETARNDWHRERAQLQKLEKQIQNTRDAAISNDVHKEFRQAQARLEDFLFYQNANNRWERTRMINPDERRAAEMDLSQRRTPYMLAAEEEAHHVWLHLVLNMFDYRGIGAVLYRQGYKDKLGNDIRSQIEAPSLQPVGPDELHLWTPALNRKTVGLGRNLRGLWRPQASELQLNEDEIEARRREVEMNIHANDPPQMPTHDERRQEELRTFGPGTASRPTTSNVRLVTSGSGQSVEDCFRKIQTRQGLFIAAKENSRDWLTSYDCLGIVKTAEIPAVIPTSDVRDDPVNVEGTDEAGESSQVATTGGVIRQSERHKSKMREPKTDYPYPYPDNEFTRASQVTNTQIDLLQTQAWEEETTGRREWHDYGYMAPSSPVDSPPHVPLNPHFVNLDIPTGFSLNEIEPSPLETGVRRKCPFDSETCRAWWKHSKQDCWFAYPEEPTRPVGPNIRLPVLEIDAPKGEDEYIPREGINIYKGRLRDHYGLTHNLHPERKEPRWPQIGVRVPYEPTTFDDLRLNPHKKRRETVSKLADHDESETRPAKRVKLTHGLTLAKDAGMRTVHEIRSLTVPIIEVPQGFEGQLSNDSPAGDNPSPAKHDHKQTESEEEGDLFTRSYRQGPSTVVQVNVPPNSSKH